MQKLTALDMVALILLVIGGLNWGLVGFFDYNLVGHVFGSMPMLGKLVYDVIGLAALYQIFQFKSIRDRL